VETRPLGRAEDATRCEHVRAADGGEGRRQQHVGACQGPSRADPGIWRGAAVAGVEMLTYAACPIKEV
jgi:hypothetical protein